MWLYKGRRRLRGVRSVLCLFCGGGLTNLHVQYNLIELHTHAHTRTLTRSFIRRMDQANSAGSREPSTPGAPTHTCRWSRLHPQLFVPRRGRASNHQANDMLLPWPPCQYLPTPVHTCLQVATAGSPSHLPALCLPPVPPGADLNQKPPGTNQMMDLLAPTHQ